MQKEYLQLAWNQTKSSHMSVTDQLHFMVMKAPPPQTEITQHVLPTWARMAWETRAQGFDLLSKFLCSQFNWAFREGNTITHRTRVFHETQTKCCQWHKIPPSEVPKVIWVTWEEPINYKAKKVLLRNWYISISVVGRQEKWTVFFLPLSYDENDIFSVQRLCLMSLVP